MLKLLGLMIATAFVFSAANMTAAEDTDTKLAAFPEVKIAEGEAWPGFYLPDLDGNALSVQDYRGKKIVLHIFASW